MMMIDRKTFDALAALTAHPKAFFSLQQLLDHLAAHPDENPLVYANAVKLQLDVQAALETYLEGRKQLGLRNVMEGLVVGAGALAMAVGRTTQDVPMPDQDVAASLAHHCVTCFGQNLHVSWKAPQWSTRPTHEPPHATN